MATSCPLAHDGATSMSDSVADWKRRSRVCGRVPFGSRAGMTLIEVLLSMGILAVSITVSGGYLMDNVRQNRQMAMAIAGLQAINEVVGEIEDLADATSLNDTLARAVVEHFDNKTGETLAIGPHGAVLNRAENNASEGCLIYRFWVPAPGQSKFLEIDSRFVPNHKAVGEMRIYLDESRLNANLLSRFSWTDLSNDPVPSTSGIDLDLNGSKTDNLLNNYADVKQLAIVFDVIFYSDLTHRHEVHRSSRNILVTRLKDATKNFVPTKGG